MSDGQGSFWIVLTADHGVQWYTGECEADLLISCGEKGYRVVHSLRLDPEESPGHAELQRLMELNLKSPKLFGQSLEVILKLFDDFYRLGYKHGAQ